MSIIEKAKSLATKSHEGQKRKYTGDPYISHPKEVAKLVEMHGGSDEQIASAWLHDTIEDCGLTFDDIELECGSIVARYTLWLSNLSTKNHGNRKIRKALDAAALALAPIEVKDIKVCDIINNSKSIMKHNPEFGKVYLREKAVLLSTSLKDANPALLSQAWAILLNE